VIFGLGPYDFIEKQEFLDANTIQMYLVQDPWDENTMISPGFYPIIFL